MGMPPTLRLVQGEPTAIGLVEYVWLHQPAPTTFGWHSQVLTIPIAQDEEGIPIPEFGAWTFTDPHGVRRMLSPCHYAPDPLRPQPSYLAACEIRSLDDQRCLSPRAQLRKTLSHATLQGTWLGFGQPYALLPQQGSRFGVAERHLLACIDAGLLIHSAGFSPGSDIWYFKIGPRRMPETIDPDLADPLITCDHLVLARHLLERLAAEQSLTVTLPAACDLYFSTPATRTSTRGAQQLAIKVGGQAHLSVSDPGTMYVKVTGFPAADDPYTLTDRFLTRLLGEGGPACGSAT